MPLTGPWDGSVDRIDILAFMLYAVDSDVKIRMLLEK
jgi:hypothetical protein